MKALFKKGNTYRTKDDFQYDVVNVNDNEFYKKVGDGKHFESLEALQGLKPKEVIEAEKKVAEEALKAEEEAKKAAETNKLQGKKS